MPGFMPTVVRYLQLIWRLTFDKRHPMRPTTVRTLYPGTHRVEVQLNGVRVAAFSKLNEYAK